MIITLHNILTAAATIIAIYDRRNSKNNNSNNSSNKNNNNRNKSNKTTKIKATLITTAHY